MALRQTLKAGQWQKLVAARWNSHSSTTTTSKAPAQSPLDSVTGLTENVVLKPPATGSVGPGASHSADYKVPEYFLYGRHSYHEAEIEMAKYRCPQPNANKKM